MRAKSNLLETPYWDQEWGKWFSRYSLGYPRLGVWLRLNYSRLCNTYLELGAGSGRESRYLAQFADQVSCVDFSPSVVELLKNSNPPHNLHAHVMNAFSLDLPDKTFDLSFHKGFWSYFESDDDIAMLFREQLRVTKQYLIILVHNASNTRMVADFGKKAVNDDLYNVRFFQPNKLKEHLERQLSTLSVSATLRLRKFGGLDRIYRLPCQPCLLGLRDVLLANTYRFLPWSWAESIAVEVKLDGGT